MCGVAPSVSNPGKKSLVSIFPSLLLLGSSGLMLQALREEFTSFLSSLSSYHTKSEVCRVVTRYIPVLSLVMQA